MKLTEQILEKLNFPTEVFIIDKSIKDSEVSLYDLHHFLDSLLGMMDRYPKYSSQIETRIKRIEKLIWWRCGSVHPQLVLQFSPTIKTHFPEILTA